MLVTFHTKGYPDITMFGDVAVKLLKLLGHTGTVPSAIGAADVPAALARLRTAVAAQKAAEQSAPPADEPNEGGAPAVALSQRALPLIELLGAAAARGAAVMWDS